MTYDKLRLGVSPITKTVYAGRLNKKGDTWIYKKDITEDFLRCCVDYFDPGTENTLSVDGEPTYIITVKKVDKTKENSE